MTLEEIRAALQTGGLVTIPAGDYWVDSDGLVAAAGTHIVCEPGAVLRMQPTNLGNYELLTLTDDCVLEGGVTVGDVASHLGTAGEWGHCVAVRGKRVQIFRHEAREAWGDGFNVSLGADDAQLIDCVADSNRRQGLSVTGAARVAVFGGRYITTGALGAAAPTAGIDMEPNPNSFSVDDFTIEGVTVSGNAGPGLLLVRAAGTTCSGTVDNLTSHGNRTGITATGTAGVLDVTVRNCTVTDSTAQGIICAAAGMEVHGGKVLHSGDIGVYLLQPARMSGLRVAESGRSGVRLDADAGASDLAGLLVECNGRAANDTYQEVHINGASNVRLRQVSAYPAATGNRTRNGLYISGPAARLVGCDSTAGTRGSSYTRTDTVVI